jgi:hypothetical protein
MGEFAGHQAGLTVLVAASAARLAAEAGIKGKRSCTARVCMAR